MTAFIFLIQKFDYSTWTYKKWLAIHQPIIFSIFGHIICLYYVYQMFKQNKSQFAKHLQVRHKKLFIAHMLLCWYFIFPHGIIASFMVICDVSMVIIYCYGYFFVSLIFLIWGTRMWILYWDYSVSSLKIKTIWMKHIDEKYESSFFLTHPNFGRISYIFAYLTPVIIIANIFIYIICYVTHFNELFHVIGAIYFLILASFLNILCIQLHMKHKLDNYNVRREFTWLFMLVSITLAILIIPYFIITDNYIRVWIVGDGICFVCFITIPVTAKIILNQISSDDDEMKLANLMNNTAQSRIIKLLQNPLGINTFAEWLVGEFSVESLIFIIEVCQFKTLLRKHIIENNEKYVFNDKQNLYFEISHNIPLSQSIYSNLCDHSDNSTQHYNYSKIAESIVRKFIVDEYLELSVNLSYEERRKLSTLKYEEYNNIKLYSVFDEAFREILKLLRDPYQRFSRSSNYKQVLQLQISSSNSSNVSNGLNTKTQIQKDILNKFDNKLHLLLHNVAKWMNHQCLRCCCC